MEQTKGYDTAQIEGLIEQLANHDGSVRQTARETLIENGHYAVLYLVGALRDHDSQIRWEAAKALVGIQDPVAAMALVDALEDENSGVRWLAAEGLIALRLDGVYPLLQALIQHSDSVRLREGAHHVLRTLADDGLNYYVEPVVEALDGVEPTLQVPVAAYYALQTIRGRLNVNGEHETRIPS